MTGLEHVRFADEELIKTQVLKGEAAQTIIRGENCSVYKMENETGEGVITRYPVFPGIELLYDDTIGFTLPLAVQSLKEWVREFPVDLVRLQEKFCAGRHPRVIHGAPSVDHIFQELYAVPEQIKLPYFRIKVLELLLYLDALELDGRTEKPYFYKSQVEKVKAAHHLLTEDLERHYTIAELSARFSIPATALKECFKSVYGQPVNTYMRNLRMDRAALLLRQEPQTSVAEIAGRVGYDSASKFAAVFREAKGKTPLEYRREGR